MCCAAIKEANIIFNIVLTSINNAVLPNAYQYYHYLTLIKMNDQSEYLCRLGLTVNTCSYR